MPQGGSQTGSAAIGFFATIAQYQKVKIIAHNAIKNPITIILIKIFSDRGVFLSGTFDISENLSAGASSIIG
jgi:hypothetical protein